MTLFAFWKEGNKTIMAAQAQAILNDWKKFEYLCEGCKEQLSPIKDCFKTNQQGTEFYVSSHFSHKPDSTCKLAKGESEEHKSRKAQILSALYTEKIKIKVNGTKLVIDPFEIKGNEITIKDNRADILISFNQLNPLFGLGIAIEVMESEDYQSIEDKIEHWGWKGYSVIAIGQNELIGDLIKNGISCEQPYLLNLIKEAKTKLAELKIAIEQAKQLPHLQKHNSTINENSCLNCFYGSNDKDLKGNIIQGTCCCWLWQRKGLQKRPDKYNQTNICNFWRGKQ